MPGHYQVGKKETRQKGFPNILRSYVIVLASVYCYCLRAEQSDHQHAPELQCSLVNCSGPQ